MSVRAKFKVDSVERIHTNVPAKNPDGTVKHDDRGYQVYEMGEARTVKMSPVYGNGDPNYENTKFWAASPGGSLVLQVVNLSAAEAFELGREYYLDFSPAPVEG